MYVELTFLTHLCYCNKRIIIIFDLVKAFEVTLKILICYL